MADLAELIERLAFLEEAADGQRLRLFVTGEIDDSLLDGLEAYIGRQRVRLSAVKNDVPWLACEQCGGSGILTETPPSQATPGREG